MSREIRLGWARTSEGGFYGVDLKDGDAILLCCNKSIYEDVSGNEKVEKVVDAFDICEILKVGDYVNGYEVNDINVQGRIIYCCNFAITLTPEQIKDVVTQQRYNSVKFVMQNAYDRVKELEANE